VPVDVVTETTIDRPLEEVASYVADPSNAPEWYPNIASADWRTPPLLQRGSRIAFVARFMGRRLEYTYEVIDFVPNERLVMRTVEGPFAMETTYTWQAVGESQTRMTLRNRGGPSGFGKVAAPVMAVATRRANEKDLQNLRLILEGRHAVGETRRPS
jgi:uncharacterized protein YndB with AHSA1/START domain